MGPAGIAAGSMCVRRGEEGMRGLVGAGAVLAVDGQGNHPDCDRALPMYRY
jgi:hypothetical protein